MGVTVEKWGTHFLSNIPLNYFYQQPGIVPQLIYIWKRTEVFRQTDVGGNSVWYTLNKTYSINFYDFSFDTCFGIASSEKVLSIDFGWKHNNFPKSFSYESCRIRVRINS